MNPSTTSQETAIQYVGAMQGITDRVKYLFERTAGNPVAPLSGDEVKEVVYELISISQSVKNIVYFTNNYIASNQSDLATVQMLRDAISGRIAEIMSHVYKIKAYVEASQVPVDLGHVCYN